MSWSLFKTECMVLTGMPHVSDIQFSQKMAQAYHNVVLRHFDTLSAGGTVVNTSPKLPMLIQGFLQISSQNKTQHSQVNWIQQIGQFILQYWAGAMIVGPTGIVNVTSVGTWTAPPPPPNTDFQIFLNLFIATAMAHIATLTGIYTSTVIVVPSPLVLPWSGAMLMTTP